MDIVAHRTQYYRHMTGAVFNILGVPNGQIHFVEASSYELTKEFMIDTYKLAALTDEKEVRNTGDEYRNSTKLSVLFCPGLPGLAEEYLDSDFQFGGEDQVHDFPEQFAQAHEVIMAANTCNRKVYSNLTSAFCRSLVIAKGPIL